MRAGLLVTLILGALTALGGCASAETREAIDPSTDPAWIPPGQGDLAVADSPNDEPKAKPKPRPRRLQQPNHRETDSRPLHAKTAGWRQ